MGKKLFKTVHDVARAAGVSVATISRVLNQHPNVSQGTREKVLALIEQSGFRPNAIARRLAQGRSGMLCFLLANRDIIHSFHSRVLKGVEDYCRQHHRQVIFTRFDYGPNDAMPAETLPRMVREYRAIDGVLVAGTNYPNLLQYFSSVELPYVLFGNNLVTGSLALPAKHAVSFDEQAGARDATQFLFELGHRHITFVGNLALHWYLRRQHGYASVMNRYGLPPATIDIRDEADCVELGRRSVPLLLRQFPRTTAILAQDDETAIGIMETLRRLEIRVPQDISLMGYDDISEIRYLRPALSSVRVPKAAIGWQMAETLAGVAPGKRTRALPPLATELVIRDSCMRLPSAPE
ncbi:MAG: LacI family DNA-binding transcriptional regulator [Bryobacterales bacterium]|nr:LacI family DNA-binding transcriptional regulator [Bryobacterales bacterium]